MFGGIPFEQFAHGGGGMPGGMPGRGGPPADVDTTKLYETLEIEKTADAKEIKKAYRKLSRTHHPDKGGDEHKFKEINAAYEILSDEDKRKAYDKYGLDGVSEDGPSAGGGGGEDLFSMFFGGGGGRGGRQGPRKGPSIQHPLKVSLEDLYNGKTVKLAVNRKVIVGEPKVCQKCDGQGAVMEIRQLGPGMITQMQRHCDQCNGKGTEFKTKNERKVLEVHVDKGMKHNEKITFREMADEQPSMEPGDIHFVVQEKEHDLFKRKGADLLVTRDVSLNQALCGYTWKFDHLDKRTIVVKTKPGEIIRCEMKEGDKTIPFIKMIKDEGMPSRGNPFVRGNLYILFHVRFPEDNTLSEEAVAALRKALPEADVAPEYDPMEVEEVHMDSADLRHFGKGGAVSHSAGEYDSDEEGGAQPVQCQQS
mmetsp:Transcript_28883/g.40591  ORF Transcript_28883/g.40591 Transcript_28883/m.40591 type:complete len:421 (+) Transcript_28883:184-1446(+)